MDEALKRLLFCMAVVFVMWICVEVIMWTFPKNGMKPNVVELEPETFDAIEKELDSLAVQIVEKMDETHKATMRFDEYVRNTDDDKNGAVFADKSNALARDCRKSFLEYKRLMKAYHHKTIVEYVDFVRTERGSKFVSECDERIEKHRDEIKAERNEFEAGIGSESE